MTETGTQAIDKYQIVAEIGHGGFATVYRAKDTELEREVALKVLDPLLMRDGAFVERFQREARSAARLEHPQIVPIYDVGEGAGRLFISMRLIRGPSLAQYLAEKERLSWKETLRILNEVGDALAYAHEEGIIHRDLKPDNILLDERSGALLTDFGFARLVGTSSLTQSISGGIVGTPAYIPPEIWEGATARPATDVYALACVIYEMLTGKILFGGETPMAIMRAHDKGAMIPDIWPETVPEELKDILASALAQHPQKRTTDINSLLQTLNRLQTKAEKKRKALEIGELLRQSRQALERHEYDTAVSLTEQILEIDPDYAEAKRLLRKAQRRLEKKDQILRQVQEKREHLSQERHTLVSKQQKIETQIEEIRRETEALVEERRTIKQRLAELNQSIKNHEKNKAQSENDLWALTPAIEELNGQEGILRKVMDHVKNGKLDEASCLLKSGNEPQKRPDKGSPKRIIRSEPITLGYRTCPRCGALNPTRVLHCLSCGASLKIDKPRSSNRNAL